METSGPLSPSQGERAGVRGFRLDDVSGGESESKETGSPLTPALSP